MISTDFIGSLIHCLHTPFSYEYSRPRLANYKTVSSLCLYASSENFIGFFTAVLEFGFVVIVDDFVANCLFLLLSFSFFNLTALPFQ